MKFLLGYIVFVLMLELMSDEGLTCLSTKMSWNVERILVKLHACIIDVNVAEIIHTFWNEWQLFVKETGVYPKRNMWNMRDTLDDKSTGWHELYSRSRTDVLGYVAPRCTSVMTGMGVSERAWSCIIEIMTAGRGSLGEEKILTVYS